VVDQIRAAGVGLDQRLEDHLGEAQPGGADLRTLPLVQRQAADRNGVGGGGERQIEVHTAGDRGRGVAVDGPSAGGVGVELRLDRIRSMPARHSPVERAPGGIADDLIFQPAGTVQEEHRGPAQLPEGGVVHQPGGVVPDMVQSPPHGGVNPAHLRLAGLIPAAQPPTCRTEPFSLAIWPVSCRKRLIRPVLPRNRSPGVAVCTPCRARSRPPG
jgi:hypothetical protein